MLQIKRVYYQPSPNDGIRVLVDRLWPRGITKKEALVDLWLKDIAPSKDLRLWFNHRPERFAEFSIKYNEELSHNPDVAKLKKMVEKQPTITLIYAAKDPLINHAEVLSKFIKIRN